MYTFERLNTADVINSYRSLCEAPTYRYLSPARFGPIVVDPG